MKKYQFKKPEITNVWKAVWNTIKIRWQFWILILLLVGTFTFDLLSELWLVHFWFVSLVAVSVYITAVQLQISTLFWKRFAIVNGWQYKNFGNLGQEAGVMFKFEHGGGGTISHVVEGIANDRQFRIFNYKFSVGSGDGEIRYYYTVFAFKFNGAFPHIYLKNKHNSYHINIGEKISLPLEFANKFSLFAPKEYETEALEIFTPDVLAALLDNDFPHDVEFVDQEALIFTSGQIDSFEQLEKEFNRALEIEDMLDEKLDKFKFEKIGDMPHTLS